MLHSPAKMMRRRLSGMLVFFLAMSPNITAIAVTIVPSAPQIKARSYLVMDYATGAYLVEHHIEQRVEPASLTKMMTVYVVASEMAEGNLSLSDMVLVSEKAWRMGGSRMFIEVNKKVSVADLLKGVIIQSGNDASVALAEYVAGSEAVFADMMNQYALKLGMENTHFVNSSGLPDEEHYTTARDLSILARRLIKDHPAIYGMHAIKAFTFNDIKQTNRNSLLWKDDSVDGIKTGHTQSAGYCLVVSARRDGMRLISVVMGADGVKARTRATQTLLNYAYRFFERKQLYSAGEMITTDKVWKGDKETVAIGLAADLLVTIPRGQYQNIKPVVEMKNNLIAPIDQGQELGHLRLILGDDVIAASPLVALDAVSAGHFFNRMMDEIKLLFE